MRRAHPLAVVLVGSSLLALGGVAASCSATSQGETFGSGGSSGTGGAATTSQGAGGDSTGVGGGFGFGGSDGGLCTPGCTPDGKGVVDCQGGTQTCGSGQLCAGGSCKPACQAAIEQKSSVGCDYYAVDMDGFASAQGGCFAVFVANTFPDPAHLTTSFGGTPIDLAKYARIPQGTGKSLTYGPYDAASGLAPGQVAILFLAQSAGVTCPVPAAIGANAQVKGTGLGTAFRLGSDVPVVAYQMLPYGGGTAAVTGASLLLPTSAWDTNYIAVNAYAASPLAGTSPSMNLVAAEDDTKVTILPKVNLVGGPGVAGGTANQPATYTLAAGQVLQITQPQELTGSPIQSDKPIGLWAGHPCLNVPTSMNACDHAEQQIPPVRALGSAYAAVSYRARSAVPENPPWRIIGAVEGTQLTFDPPIAGAPSAVSLGEVKEFTTDTPFVVKSQDDDHPFILVTYMTGEETVTQFYGDADFVRIVPTGQYLSRYVFFTDPTYPDTNLVVVRKKGDAGFSDVKLDCAGTLSGWTPLGAAGDLEWTRIDLVSGDFTPQNGCDNGRHEMTSEQPFGLWVWGWGTPGTNPSTISVSYGYPAGEGVTLVNDVVVPPVPK
jgi:hypothetical protein